MKKKAIIITIIVAVMAIFIVMAIKNKPAEDETIGGYKEGPRVEVAYVEKQDIDTKVSSSGKLEAVDTQTLYLDAANKIVTIHKEVGDTVKAGDLIITLDQEAQLEAQNQRASIEKKLAVAKQELANLQSTSSNGEILSAQASIATLKNTKEQTQQTIKQAQDQIETLKRQLQDKKDELKMTEELLQEGLASQDQVDQLNNGIDDVNQQITKLNDNITYSQSTLATVELQIKNAQYNLDVLQKKVVEKSTQEAIAQKQSQILELENQLQTNANTLEKASTQVIAPMSGVITYLPEEEGMSLAAGSQLVTIVDTSKLKVSCDISTYYAPDLKVGLEAIIKYTGSRTIEVPGKVSKVSPVAKAEKTTNGETISIPVEVQITDPGEIIKPGFNVDVKIITDSRMGACTVPILAIDEDEDMRYVYVVGEDGTLERREVTEGISNGLNIEVTGVKEGEMIVSSIEDYVQDGAKVSYEKIGDVK